MKSLHFFGCSFTSLETSDTGYTFINYRKLIEDKIKENVNNETGFYNHSFVGKSNQEIINDVYLQSKNLKTGDDVFIIQTTFTDRLGLHFDLDNKFISCCKRFNAESFKEKIIIDFYNEWLKYFYSRESALFEYQKQIDFLCSYLNSLRIRYILIGMDESLDSIDNQTWFEKNNFLMFEKYKSFYSYAVFNKLRISDVTIDNTSKPFDHHFNQLGHKILADKVLQKLNTII